MPRCVSRSRAPMAPLGAQLERYAPRQRPALVAFAAQSKARADLLASFPAAAIALACKRVDTPRRTRTLQRLDEGARLSALGQMLALPRWSRRLAPEALWRALPTCANDPCDAAFGRKITNALPTKWIPGDRYLELVLWARQVVGDEYAIWLATALRDLPARITPGAAGVLAAWAFHGAEPGSAAHQFIERTWSRAMALAPAAQHARLWLLRLILFAQSRHGSSAFTPSWIAGHHFVELRTYAGLVQEGASMRHCVADYAERVALGRSRIFSVRYNGQRRATLEVGSAQRGLHTACIKQIRGPGNTLVSPALGSLCLLWLEYARLATHSGVEAPPSIEIDRDLWRKLLSRYLERDTTPMALSARRAANPAAILRDLRRYGELQP